MAGQPTHEPSVSLNKAGYWTIISGGGGAYVRGVLGWPAMSYPVGM